MYIKSILIAFGLMTFSAFAQMDDTLKTCLTHGDCQSSMGTTEGSKCLIIKTGTDPQGNKTCALRCYTARFGSTCKSIEGEFFGYCKKEVPLIPVFDEADPNRCADAVSL